MMEVKFSNTCKRQMRHYLDIISSTENEEVIRELTHHYNLYEHGYWEHRKAEK